MEPKRPIHLSLDAFSVKDLQTFKVIITTLEREGHSIPDAVGYIGSITARSTTADLKRRQHLEAARKKCPDCNALMNLFPVNDSPGTQVGGEYKSVWFCHRCGSDYYLTKPPHEEMSQRLTGEKVTENP